MVGLMAGHYSFQGNHDFVLLSGCHVGEALRAPGTTEGAERVTA